MKAEDIAHILDNYSETHKDTEEYEYDNSVEEEDEAL